MIINGTKIDESEKPYIVAELSANHGGSIERAKQSIRAAARTGISAASYVGSELGGWSNYGTFSM